MIRLADFDLVAHNGSVGITPEPEDDDRFISLCSLEVLKLRADDDLAALLP